MNAYEYECYIDQTAREFSKSHGGVMTIVYLDPETGNPNGELTWASEPTWDRMLDNGQVETSWIKYIITEEASPAAETTFTDETTMSDERAAEIASRVQELKANTPAQEHYTQIGLGNKKHIDTKNKIGYMFAECPECNKQAAQFPMVAGAGAPQYTFDLPTDTDTQLALL